MCGYEKIHKDISSYGLCIPIHRLRQISSDVTKAIIKLFNYQKAPVPPCLSKNVFTVGTTDNINKNQVHRDAKQNLDATALVLTQLPQYYGEGIERTIEYIRTDSDQYATLPRYYTEIEECNINFPKGTMFLPEITPGASCRYLPNFDDEDRY